MVGEVAEFGERERTVSVSEPFKQAEDSVDGKNALGALGLTDFCFQHGKA
jgi:hypothetical protein